MDSNRKKAEMPTYVLLFLYTFYTSFFLVCKLEYVLKTICTQDTLPVYAVLEVKKDDEFKFQLVH